MAKKVLRGKAPLTLVRTEDGRMVYVYAGRPAPENITTKERRRLLDGKFLAEVEVEEAEDGEAPKKTAAAKKAAAGK